MAIVVLIVATHLHNDHIAQGRPARVSLSPEGKYGEESMLCGGQMEVFIEPITLPSMLYIFGGGHISLPLVKMGGITGFRSVVVDDRADFANPGRFPEAEKTITRDFAEAFSTLSIDNSSNIIITRSHATDEVILKMALETSARYIGMVVSQKKIDAIFSHLRDAGISREQLDRVHAPIGIDIHAETSEEIAVSILAEIRRVNRSLQTR